MSGKIKYWTEARIADLRMYARQGLTAPEAGAKFNKSAMAIHWQGHRLGIKFTPVKPSWTKQQDAILRDMISAGSGWKEVGKVLGKSKSCVRGYAVKNGIMFIGKPKAGKLVPKHAKPIESKPNPPELRKCLTCQTMFPSWGIGNRRCKPCKSSVVYQNSGSAMI